MKKFFYTVILAVMAVTMLDSCLGNNVFDEYKNWREKNDEWFNEQAASGKYTKVTAPWDPSATVLMRWHNDRNLTKDNLVPLITSTVDVKYYLRLCDGTPVDSSYYMTSPADSIYRSIVNQNVEGWMLALTNMHVGDSCTVIIPYQQAYGSTKRSDVLIPYSSLMFDVKLVNIYKYKTN
jgi:FKBP-type peptidyl-prolyl cis-trans isomerase FklB